MASVVDLIVKSDHIVTSYGTFSGEIAIENGRIVALGKHLNLKGDTYVDYSGKIIFPGVIDAHVHVYDTDDFFNGTMTALYGGITTLIDLPPTEPQIMDKESFTKKMSTCNEKSLVDFGLVAGEIYYTHHIAKIPELNDLGAAYFKIFMPGPPSVEDVIIFKTLEKLSKVGSVAAIHAENPFVLNYLTEKAKKSGRTDPRVFADYRPSFLEVDAIHKSILFAQETNARIHICHVTTKEGVHLIREAKQRGIKITAELAPHYLYFTKEDLNKVGALLKITPPLRTKEDQEAIWNGLLNGTIDIVVTDHCSFTKADKSENIWDAAAGLPGMQFLLQLMFTRWIENNLSLERLATILARSPAKIFGLSYRKGDIALGLDADLVVFNPKVEEKITNDILVGKSDFTPYEGMLVKGKVEDVYIRGIHAFSDGQVLVKRGFGEYIKAKH
ncbi:MAG: dihydroorotase [Candidatus Asgardarchaeia archaeon]